MRRPVNPGFCNVVSDMSVHSITFFFLAFVAFASTLILLARRNKEFFCVHPAHIKYCQYADASEYVHETTEALCHENKGHFNVLGYSGRASIFKAEAFYSLEKNYTTCPGGPPGSVVMLPGKFSSEAVNGVAYCTYHRPEQYSIVAWRNVSNAAASARSCQQFVPVLTIITGIISVFAYLIIAYMLYLIYICVTDTLIPCLQAGLGRGLSWYEDRWKKSTYEFTLKPLSGDAVIARVRSHRILTGSAFKRMCEEILTDVAADITWFKRLSLAAIFEGSSDANIVATDAVAVDLSKINRRLMVAYAEPSTVNAPWRFFFGRKNRREEATPLIMARLPGYGGVDTTSV